MAKTRSKARKSVLPGRADIPAANPRPQHSRARSSKPLPPPPNILFIIVDDMTYRAIHSLNNTEVHTPHLDALAHRSTVFTHCFHQGSWVAAVCVASRTMLNTGLTTFHAERQAEDATLWTQVLGQAGYDTHIVGKWHLSEHNLQRAFKTFGPLVPGGMFESSPVGGAAYHRPAPGSRWRPWDKSQGGHWLRAGDWLPGGPDKIIHSGELEAQVAADFLLGRKGQTRPFCLYVGFHLPHDPRQAEKKYVDLYPPGKVALPPNYLPCHPFDQGDYAIRDELLAPFPRTPAAVQLHRAEYYAAVTQLDAAVGRVLQALEQSGQAPTTYIVFTADHGLAVGEHGLLGKQNLYDCSVRVPLLLAGPGVPRGRQLDTLVYQHSIATTLLELVGVRRPAGAEFPSLAGLLRGQGRAPHDAIFGRYLHYQRSIRIREYKLIFYPESRVTQLFDLRADPWETANLAEVPHYLPIKAQLMQRLVQMAEELDDPLKME